MQRGFSVVVFVLGLLTALPGLLTGQNLIPNGSFENYRNCPRLDNLLEEAIPWFNPNRATPDFYHQCFQTGQLQLAPHSGQGVAHLFFDQGWTEYLAVQLTKPLVAGECYYFEMFVAMDTPNKYIPATLGACFTTKPLTGTTTETLVARPQVLDGQLRPGDPRLTWERMSGFVNAEGGEEFVTIGNFYKSPGFLGFYYIYIDDITLRRVDLELGRDTTLCGHKSTYLLNAATPGATDYLWSDGSTQSTLLVSKPGSYSVKVTTDCKILRDFIKVDYALNFDLGADTTLCNGQSFDLSVPASAASSYQWQDGSAQNTYTVSQPGQYSVRVKQANCLVADTIQVRYIKPPQLELGPDKELCGAELFTIKPVVAEGRFAWEDQFGDVERTVSSSGVFRATVQNECATVLDSISIDYEACGCVLYTPDAFTPNGDGQNDTFLALGCGDITIVSLSVFSRWGELVFHADKPPFQWDGFYRNQICPINVYAWTIQYRLSHGKKVILKQQQGTLSLIR